VELQLTPEAFADNFRCTCNFSSPVNIPSSHEISLSDFTNVSSISGYDVIWAIQRRTSSNEIPGLIIKDSSDMFIFSEICIISYYIERDFVPV
jgi:hypothetical protein